VKKICWLQEKNPPLPKISMVDP